MTKPAPVSLAILVLSVLMLAACHPIPATVLPATQPATLPATLPAYPPPATSVQATPSQASITAPLTQARETQPAQTEAPYPAPGDLANLATPFSDQPAAGICDLAAGSTVTFELHADIPAPRCAQALPDQRLKLVNRTDYDLEVSLAGFQASLAPGESTIFDAPLGTFLAPGVHQITTTASGGIGPELWLLASAPNETPGYPAP